MARQFNGTSNFLASASALSLSTHARIAVGFWVKTTFAPDDSMLVELSANSNSNPGSFKILADESASGELYADIVGNVGKSSGHCAPPTDSVWHHMLFNLDMTASTSEVASIFVDGVSKTLTRADIDNTGAFGDYVLYAMSRGGVGLFADGAMADLAIWAPTAPLDVTAAAALAGGARANTVHGGEVVYYWPLAGSTSPEPATVGTVALTVTGATSTADPPALAGGTSVALPVAPEVDVALPFGVQGVTAVPLPRAAETDTAGVVTLASGPVALPVGRTFTPLAESRVLEVA